MLISDLRNHANAISDLRHQLYGKLAEVEADIRSGDKGIGHETMMADLRKRLA